MRILRLVSDGQYAIEFHPYVTVVTGLDETQRMEVIETFQRAVAGRATDLTGLLEVHGVVLDMDERSFQLLDLGDAAIDLVVQVESLPGAASTGLGRRLESAERRLAELEQPHFERRSDVQEAETAADQAHQAVIEARSAAEAESSRNVAESAQVAEAVAELEKGLAAAEEAVDALAEPGSLAAGSLQQAERAVEQATLGLNDHDEDVERLEALEQRRHELVEELDPDAANELEAAISGLDEADEALEDARSHATAARAELETLANGASEPPVDAGDGPDDTAVGPIGDDGDPGGSHEATGSPEPEGSAEDNDDACDDATVVRIEQLRSMVALQESFDPEPVRSALDAFRLNPAAGDLVPSPEALSTADRLEELGLRIEALERRVGDPADHRVIDEMQQRLDQIRSELVAEERATTSPATIDADIAELERAHAEVVEASEALDGRFGRARARTRLDEARAAEDAVLVRLGIRSYTDFMSGGRARMHIETEPEELRRLRAEEREADRTLREFQSEMDAALELAAVAEDRRTLRAHARMLLGGADVSDDGLTSALLDLRVPAGSGSPISALVDALDGVGLSVGSLDLEPDELEAMAAEWLDEYFRAEDRRAGMAHELAVLESGSTVGRDDDGRDESDIDVTGADDAAGADEETRAAEEAARAADDAAARETERAAAETVAFEAMAVAETEVTLATERRDAALEVVKQAKSRVVAHEAAVAAIGEIQSELEARREASTGLADARAQVEASELDAAEARASHEEIEARRTDGEREIARLRSEIAHVARAAEAAADEVADRLAAAEAAAVAADDRLRRARADFDEARTDYDAAVEEVATLRNAVAEVSDEPAPVDEIEWYLLARLAGQRQVSFAGSVPLVVDRALDGVAGDGLLHLLDRLERMAGAVQVVHLSDDERVLAWAASAGEDRVAIVEPVAARLAGRDDREPGHG